MSSKRSNSQPVTTPGPSWPDGCWPNEEQQWLLLACLHPDDDIARRAFLQWERMVPLELADTGSAKLLLLLYHRLRKWEQQSRSLPWLKGTARYSWVKHQMIARHLEAILKMFREAGISTLLLKGAALNGTVYPDGQRLMSDLDIAISREKATEAFELLSEQGWTSKFKNADRMIDASHGSHFERGVDAQLDLHWDFFHGRYLDEKEQALLWDNAESTTVGKEASLVLCPTDQLLHTCEHGVRHDCFSPPFRWLADCWHILTNAETEIDFERLAKLASRFKLLPQVRHSLDFLEKLIPGTVPPEGLKIIRGEMISPRQALENAIIQRRLPATHYVLQSLPENLLNYWRRRQGGQETGLSDYLAIICDLEPPFFGSLKPAVRIERKAFTERLAVREARNSGQVGRLYIPTILLPEHSLEGVYPPEIDGSAGFRWTEPRAGIALPLEKGRSSITISLLPARPLENYADSLVLRLNRTTIDRSLVEIDGTTITFPIEPPMFLNYSHQRLEIHCSRWQEASADPRTLGLPITSIEVLEIAE